MNNLKHFLGAYLFFASGVHLARSFVIDGARLNEHIKKLAEFGRNAEGFGTSRVAYNDADRQGRDYVQTLMRDAGLKVTIDAAGNLIGRREGSQVTLRPLIMGSHIDTVPQGGNFDGIAGSLIAIEIAQSLAEQKLNLRHPLEVIIFSNEEGGHIGSRAITSGLSEKDLKLVTLSGKTVEAGMQFIGGEPKNLNKDLRQPGSDAAYLELHIEQGAVLERQKINLGIVQGIVGIRRWEITFEGEPNHAGTTPMVLRKDALAAAADWIVRFNRLVRSFKGKQVGTVGRLDVSPNAPNVIPGRVVMSAEIRDLAAAKLESLYKGMILSALTIGKLSGVKINFKETYNTSPELADPRIKAMIKASADELKLSHLELPSGAGHDAQEWAHLGPMGMIFIPSVGGISHSPKEFTASEDIERGANVMLSTLQKMDVAFDSN